MPEPKKGGRQPEASSKSGQIRALLDTRMAVGDIVKKLGCTPALVYNVKARMGGKSATKRGPGRPPKAAASMSTATNMDGLAGILSAVQGAERERVKVRAALEKIHAVLRDVMA